MLKNVKAVNWLWLDDRLLLVEGVAGDESLADVGVVFNLQVTEDDDENDESDDTDDECHADADDCSQSRYLRVRCLHAIAQSV